MVFSGQVFPESLPAFAEAAEDDILFLFFDPEAFPLFGLISRGHPTSPPSV